MENTTNSMTNEAVNATYEEGEMKTVKKASELKDLKELNLDSQTRAQIKQKMKSKEWSLEDWINAVRYEAFYNHTMERPFDDGAAWLKASIRALSEAGFIRHDIVYYDSSIRRDEKCTHISKIDIYTKMARIILKFYRFIFDINSKCYFNTRRFSDDAVIKYIEYLEGLKDPLNRYEENTSSIITTANYEQYYAFLGRVYSIIDNYQRGDPQRLIKILDMLFFDFTEPKKSRQQKLDEAAKMFSVACERIKQLEKNAMHIVFAHRELLPPITDFINIESKVELELHYPNNTDTDIDFDITTYDFLKSIGINSIESILSFPKDGWEMHFGRKKHLLKDIEQTMQSAGYDTFKILS